MKRNRLVLAVFLAFLASFPVMSIGQIVMNNSLTPEQMVEYLVGYGINYSNVVYTGCDTARGTFSNGATTNLGVDHGMALSSGSVFLVPGPNVSSNMSFNCNTPGDPLLDSLAGVPTWDASVIEFDFVPVSDTMWCRYVFGSEEYPEWAGSPFNDIFGFFVTGPAPGGSFYAQKNIALVPGTDLPVAINTINNVIPSFPEYYVDNTNGQTIEYDGFTTVLDAICAVVPGETYHIKMAVADASDMIFDSGVFIEGSSFESQGPSQFINFSFLAENNPGLAEDITGMIDGTTVYLTVPEGTDLTGLVATFDVPAGVVAFSNGIIQQSGTTPNDFTSPCGYLLDGRTNTEWTVVVDGASSAAEILFGRINIVPSGNGTVWITGAEGMDVTVFDAAGSVVFYQGMTEGNIRVDPRQAGVYFVRLQKQGVVQTRKTVVF